VIRARPIATRGGRIESQAGPVDGETVDIGFEQDGIAVCYPDDPDSKGERQSAQIGAVGLELQFGSRTRLNGQQADRRQRTP